MVVLYIMRFLFCFCPSFGRVLSYGGWIGYCAFYPAGSAEPSRAGLGWAERSEAGAECRSLVGGSSISAVRRAVTPLVVLRLPDVQLISLTKIFVLFLIHSALVFTPFTVVIRVYLLYII